jgi:uncharacterized damage-inducible protein DinB
MRELLIDTLAHIAPARALESLTADDAERRLPGASHSIAEIVAHIDFWQRWFCARCEGSGEPMIAKAALGWPAVPAGSWKDLEQRFLNGLERAAALGSDTAALSAPVTPAIEFPPIANFTIRDALVHVAHHNAHHLGQVIVLRQLMGLWPPPSGSWTW